MIRGRKRKPGARYNCGKLKREETEREAMATALTARQRHYGVTVKQARDERLGTSLGRLAFRYVVSEEQYQAGVIFGELYQRHHIVMGLPTPSPRSVAGILINEGIFGSSPSEPMVAHRYVLARAGRQGARGDGNGSQDRTRPTGRSRSRDCGGSHSAAEGRTGRHQ